MLAAILLGAAFPAIASADEPPVADPAPPAGDPAASAAETRLPEEAADGPADDPEERHDGDRPYWRTNLFKRLFADQKFLFTDWIGQEAHRPGVAVPFVAGIALAASTHGDDLNQPDLRLERQFNT